MKNMLAYHNNPKLKESVLAEMAAHRQADTLVQGYGYWKDGKGCAVGCLIKSSDDGEYETRFGILCILARLKERIFEGLSKADAKQWPERFLSAIPVGADLSLVWPRFAVFMLVDKDHGVLKFANMNKTKKAVHDVANLYQRIIGGEKIPDDTWLEVKKYAEIVGFEVCAKKSSEVHAALAAFLATDASPAQAVFAAAHATETHSRHFAVLATALVRFLEETRP